MLDLKNNSYCGINQLTKDLEEEANFKNDLIAMGGSNLKETTEDLASYLMLKKKHGIERIALILLPAEQEAQVDKEAWKKQQEEIKELTSKERDTPNFSYPAKK